MDVPGNDNSFIIDDDDDGDDKSSNKEEDDEDHKEPKPQEWIRMATPNQIRMHKQGKVTVTNR